MMRQITRDIDIYHKNKTNRECFIKKSFFIIDVILRCSTLIRVPFIVHTFLLNAFDIFNGHHRNVVHTKLLRAHQCAVV